MDEVRLTKQIAIYQNFTTLAGFPFGQGCVYRLRQSNRIVARLLHDDDGDARLPVDACVPSSNLGRAEFDLGNVADVDRANGVASDDCVAELLFRFKQSPHGYHGGTRSQVHDAAGSVSVRCLYRCSHLNRGDLKRA